MHFEMFSLSRDMIQLKNYDTFVVNYHSTIFMIWLHTAFIQSWYPKQHLSLQATLLCNAMVTNKDVYFCKKYGTNSLSKYRRFNMDFEQLACLCVIKIIQTRVAEFSWLSGFVQLNSIWFSGRWCRNFNTSWWNFANTVLWIKETFGESFCRARRSALLLLLLLRKGKEVYLYSAILSSISKRSDMDHTVLLANYTMSAFPS